MSNEPMTEQEILDLVRLHLTAIATGRACDFRLEVHAGPVCGRFQVHYDAGLYVPAKPPNGTAGHDCS